jgi:hypothetical protein
MGVVMRKLVCFFLPAVLVFISCLSTGNVESPVKRLEDRVIIDEAAFTNDELKIYDFLIDILIAGNSKRIPKEAMMELVNKYTIEELRMNPRLVEDITIQIDNPKIVVSDRTTIPSLRKDKTFDENMDSSLKYVNEKMGEEYNALFLDFKNNNENDYSLTEYIAKNNKAISDDLIGAAIGDVGPVEYWSKFYELNPDACGRLTFSRIGFKDNNAFIEVQFIKGSMDGFVDYIILENSGDSWEVVKSNRHIYY